MKNYLFHILMNSLRIIKVQKLKCILIEPNKFKNEFNIKTNKYLHNF